MSVVIINNANFQNSDFYFKKLLNIDNNILVIRNVLDIKKYSNFWLTFKTVRPSARAKFKKSPQYGINLMDFKNFSDRYFALVPEEIKKLHLIFNQFDPIAILKTIFADKDIEILKNPHHDSYMPYMVRFCKEIPQHSDNYQVINLDKNYHQIRDQVLNWNLFLQVPEEGGELVIDEANGQEYHPAMGDLVIFNPRQIHHVKKTKDNPALPSNHFRQFRIAICGSLGFSAEKVYLFN